MSKPSRPVHSGTFLVTTTTDNRRRLFQHDANAELFLQTLQHYRNQGRYCLHAFRIMPEHVHLLLTPIEASIERTVGLIKGGFSHQLPGLKPAWQRGFDDRRARDRRDFLSMRNYIHENPVRKHLCKSAEDWKWSSAWAGWQAAPHSQLEFQQQNGPA